MLKSTTFDGFLGLKAYYEHLSHVLSFKPILAPVADFQGVLRQFSTDFKADFKAFFDPVSDADFDFQFSLFISKISVLKSFVNFLKL